MAKEKMFRCQLITPERSVLDAEVSAVVLCAHDGEIGILRDRAPLLCKLGIGEMRVTTADRMERLYVDGGFAHVHDNELTVLTPQAITAAEVDSAKAREELTALLEKPAVSSDELRRKALAIKRLKTQIRISEHG